MIDQEYYRLFDWNLSCLIKICWSKVDIVAWSWILGCFYSWSNWICLCQWPTKQNQIEQWHIFPIVFVFALCRTIFLCIYTFLNQQMQSAANCVSISPVFVFSHFCICILWFYLYLYLSIVFLVVNREIGGGLSWNGKSYLTWPASANPVTMTMMRRRKATTVLVYKRIFHGTLSWLRTNDFLHSV